MKALTEEQKAARRATLARGRETAAVNRAAAAAKAAEAAPAEEPPIVMPSIGQHDWREADDAPELGDEAAVVEPSADDPFERFLAAQDAETRSILTDAELRVIFEVETKKAAEAKREAAKKAVQARAARAARVDAGLIAPADAEHADWLRKMARKVTFTPEMPQDANGREIDIGYRVNGEIIYPGQPWTGTYGEFLSLREQQWRAMNHEMDFEGKGKLSQQRQLSAQALTAKL